MAYICPQRGCVALHKTEHRPTGMRFTCHKCGALLEVLDDGLELIAPPQKTVAGQAGDEDAPLFPDIGPPVPDAPGTKDPMSTRPENAAPESASTTILFSLVFGFGAILTILFLFLPLIDQTKIKRQSAEIKREDRKKKKEFEKPKEEPNEDMAKGDKAKPEKPDTTEAEEKARKKGLREWEKKKEELEERVEDLRLSAQVSLYPYTWGMLFGFLFLSVGSVGFLGSRGSARKVVGAIVLSVVVVLIFNLYLFGSAARVVSGIP